MSSCFDTFYMTHKLREMFVLVRTSYTSPPRNQPRTLAELYIALRELDIIKIDWIERPVRSAEVRKIEYFS